MMDIRRETRSPLPEGVIFARNSRTTTLSRRTARGSARKDEVLPRIYPPAMVELLTYSKAKMSNCDQYLSAIYRMMLLETITSSTPFRSSELSQPSEVLPLLDSQL